VALVDKASSGPCREVALAVDAHRIEHDRSGGLRLGRDERPAVGLCQAAFDGSFGFSGLGGRLGGLLGAEAELLCFGRDRTPGERLGHPLAQVVDTPVVGGEERDHVAIQARRGAAVLEDLACGGKGRRVVGLHDVGRLWWEHDEADPVVVVDVG
jgi:hypothetical protein